MSGHLRPFNIAQPGHSFTGPILKSSFITGFIIAFALVLVAAGFYPLPGHVRILSQTTTLPNGGRQEDFTIELPGDRIALPKFAKTAPFPNQAFSADGQDRLTAELFRLRNVQGVVIGVASKTTGKIPDGSGQATWVSDWILLIPSRGALLLNQENARNQQLRVPQQGSEGAAPVVQRVTAGPAPDDEGIVVRGTDEFAGLVGSYSEVLQLEYVDAGGVAHGQINLSTRLAKNQL